MDKLPYIIIIKMFIMVKLVIIIEKVMRKIINIDGNRLAIRFRLSLLRIYLCKERSSLRMEGSFLLNLTKGGDEMMFYYFYRKKVIYYQKFWEGLLREERNF